MAIAVTLAGAIGTGPRRLRAQEQPTQASMPAPLSTFGSRRLTPEDGARATTLDAPVEHVWAAVQHVYDDLKLPPTTLVTSERRIGYDGARLRGKLAGERLAKLVDCGRALDGQDIADAYEVSLELLTAVAPSSDGVTLASLVTATAKPVSTQGDPVRCVSTGRLEARIAELTKRESTTGTLRQP